MSLEPPGLNHSRRTSEDPELKRTKHEPHKEASLGWRILGSIGNFFLSIPFFNWIVTKVSSAFNPTTEKTSNIATKTLSDSKGLEDQLSQELEELDRIAKAYPNINFDIKVYPKVEVIVRAKDAEALNLIELIEKLGGPQKIRTMIDNSHIERLLNRYEAAKKEADAHRKDEWSEININEVVPVKPELSDKEKRRKLSELLQQARIHPGMLFRIDFKENRIIAFEGTEKDIPFESLINALGGTEEVIKMLPKTPDGDNLKSKIDRYLTIKKLKDKFNM